MGHFCHSLSVDATIMISKNCSIIGGHVGIVFVTLMANIATLWPAKTPFISDLSAFISQILYMGFRATLKFWKFKVALYPMYKIFLNFTKSCISSFLSKFYNKKKFIVPFLKYKRLKLKLRLILPGHNVAMVNYCVAKLIPTCSPVIGQFYDTMIVASMIKSGYNDTSKSKSWNLLETVSFEPP